MRSMKSNKHEETTEATITGSIWKPIYTIFQPGLESCGVFVFPMHS